MSVVYALPQLLGELAGMGIGVDAAGGEDFKSLRGAVGWAELSKKLGTARAPAVRGRAVSVILFYVANTQIDRMGRAGSFNPGLNSAT